MVRSFPALSLWLLKRSWRALVLVPFVAVALIGVLVPAGGTAPALRASRSVHPLNTPPPGGDNPPAVGIQPWYTIQSHLLTDRLDFHVDVTGDLVVHGRDLSLGGNGPALVIDRYYNSMLPTQQGGFGDWTMGAGPDVTVTTLSDGSVLYVAPGGFSATFTKSGSTYLSPPGLDATIAPLSGGSYQITYNMTGRVQQFDGSGRLHCELDMNGFSVCATYNTSSIVVDNGLGTGAVAAR